MRMTLNVLSQRSFDEEMRQMGLNDENVEDSNMAFISIIGTEECLKYYLDEDDTKHYFKNHPNVLNLEFDDTSTDIDYDGHIFKCMTMEQSETSVEFIEKCFSNEIKEIKIHCRAGVSRSRAFAEFIARLCEEKHIDLDYGERNQYINHLNQDVLRKLCHAYWKKHEPNFREICKN